MPELSWRIRGKPDLLPQPNRGQALQCRAYYEESLAEDQQRANEAAQAGDTWLQRLYLDDIVELKASFAEWERAQVAAA
jgi:hypothetical protein